MKTITTSENKSFVIDWAQVITRKDETVQLVIELPEDQDFAQYAIDFDGLESLELVDDAQPGARTVYEGFGYLMGLSRKDGTVRVTIERGD